MDYRKLNDLSNRDSYHLLRKDGYINSLRDTKVFSDLDARRSYLQIEGYRSDLKSPSFTSHIAID